MMDIATRIPKEVYFSIFLSFAWSRTHEGHMNGGDIMLGTLGGFTLEPALKGGTAANAWAIAYLTALGYNFFDDIAAKARDQLESAIRDAGVDEVDVVKVMTGWDTKGGWPGWFNFGIPPVVPPVPGAAADPEQ